MKFRACLRSRALSRCPYTQQNHNACCTGRDLKKAGPPDRHPDPRTTPSRHSHGKSSFPLFVLLSRQAAARSRRRPVAARPAYFVKPKGPHSSSLRSGGAILSISRAPPSETVSEESSRASQDAHRATDQARGLTHKSGELAIRDVFLKRF